MYVNNNQQNVPLFLLFLIYIIKHLSGTNNIKRLMIHVSVFLKKNNID